MGVMSCSRRGCESIMCDTLIDSVGYVCSYCQEEFKDYLTENNFQLQHEGEIERELIKFMKTDKNSFTKGKKISVDTFFDQRRKH